MLVPIATVDTTELQRELIRTMAVSKREFSVVVQEAARGITKRVIAITPPGHFSDGASAIGATARKAGERAIVGDLFGGRSTTMGGFRVQTRGIFIVSSAAESSTSTADLIEYRSQNGKAIRRRRRPGEEDIASLFTDKTGRVYGVERNLWHPRASLQEMLAHIRKYRNPATGQISKAGLRDRVVGRHVFIDRMVIGSAAKQNLLRHLYGHVGWLSAGWARAAAALRVTGVPAWITRHSSAPGDIAMLLTGDDLSVKVSNRVQYAGTIRDLTRRVQWAVNSQAATMRRRLESFHARR
jgi:hypothetical protein